MWADVARNGFGGQGVPELSVDWIHPWIGLDCIGLDNWF